MALDDLIPDEEGTFNVSSIEHVTVGDLVEMYGEEAVRRGIQYTASLSKADENFRKATDKSTEYSKRYTESYLGEETENEEIKSKWEEGIEGGLGIDE